MKETSAGAVKVILRLPTGLLVSPMLSTFTIAFDEEGTIASKPADVTVALAVALPSLMANRLSRKAARKVESAPATVAAGAEAESTDGRSLSVNKAREAKGESSSLTSIVNIAVSTVRLRAWVSGRSFATAVGTSEMAETVNVYFRFPLLAEIAKSSSGSVMRKAAEPGAVEEEDELLAGIIDPTRTAGKGMKLLFPVAVTLLPAVLCKVAVNASAS
jgi:hypothetical protein